MILKHPYCRLTLMVYPWRTLVFAVLSSHARADRLMLAHRLQETKIKDKIIEDKTFGLKVCCLRPLLPARALFRAAL